MKINDCGVVTKLKAALVGLAMMVAGTGTAHAIAFDIQWSGLSNYTMTGMLSYDDALIGTGAINEDDIDALMIEVFLSGVSQGTWDLLTDGENGNFSRLRIVPMLMNRLRLERYVKTSKIWE